MGHVIGIGTVSELFLVVASSYLCKQNINHDPRRLGLTTKSISTTLECKRIFVEWSVVVFLFA